MNDEVKRVNLSKCGLAEVKQALEVCKIIGSPKDFVFYVSPLLLSRGQLSKSIYNFVGDPPPLHSSELMSFKDLQLLAVSTDYARKALGEAGEIDGDDAAKTLKENPPIAEALPVVTKIKKKIKKEKVVNEPVVEDLQVTDMPMLEVTPTGIEG